MAEHEGKSTCAGVTLEKNWRGQSVYSGTWKALLKANCVPAEMAKPPEPRRGGTRFRDAHKRSWSISGPYGEDSIYYVRRFALTREAKQMDALHAQEYAAAARVKQIESLLAWSNSKGQLGYALSRCVDDILQQIDRYAWSDSPERGPWTLAPEARQELSVLRQMFICGLQSLDMKHDPEWRAGLERERAMLREATDDAVGAHSAMTDAQALLARGARG